VEKAMKRLFVLIPVCVTVLFLAPSSSEASSSVVAGQIKKVGTQLGVTYFEAAAIPSSCLYGVMYVDGNFSGDAAALSRASGLLIAAYLAAKPLTNVVYVQTSDNTCHATLLEF
jgi:hypothetical protein